MFESLVNSDRSKAKVYKKSCFNEFESLVNSDRSKASKQKKSVGLLFESLVNSDRSKAIILAVKLLSLC